MVSLMSDVAIRIAGLSKQYRIGGKQEQFGLAFQKGNPLVPCVDQAIDALKTNGTLQQLQSTWLQTDASVPVFT